MFSIWSVVFLMHFSWDKEDYILRTTENAWIDNMVEYYEQHDNDLSIEPFSR